MHQYISSVTSKGQVTIPVAIRQLLGVAPHDKVAFVVEEDQVKLAPAGSVTARTAGALKSEQPMLSPAEERAGAEQGWQVEDAPSGR
jgi:AbrB family looped-hinge helix DNA binding protein